MDKPLDQMSSDELDELKTTKEKELQIEDGHLGLAEQENHRIAKAILELRIKKKDSDIALDKARHNVRKLASDIKIITSYFWNSRRRGVS